MTTRHFWTQNDPFTLKNFFFRKTIDIIFMCLLAPLIVQFFKKSLQLIHCSYSNSYNDSYSYVFLRTMPWLMWTSRQ